MVTSRTGTASHKRFRRAVLNRDRVTDMGPAASRSHTHAPGGWRTPCLPPSTDGSISKSASGGAS